jgi:hypothetical protein
MSHALWSIPPNLICLIWSSPSITSESVASFGNASAYSKWQGAREAARVFLSNDRGATRSGVWILSVLSGCSSQMFSFGRIGVISLDHSATRSLTLDHLGTRHASVCAIKGNIWKACHALKLSGAGSPYAVPAPVSLPYTLSRGTEAVLLPTSVKVT